MARKRQNDRRNEMIDKDDFDLRAEIDGDPYAISIYGDDPNNQDRDYYEPPKQSAGKFLLIDHPESPYKENGGSQLCIVLKTPMFELIVPIHDDPLGVSIHTGIEVECTRLYPHEFPTIRLSDANTIDYEKMNLSCSGILLSHHDKRLHTVRQCEPDIFRLNGVNLFWPNRGQELASQITVCPICKGKI